MPRIFFGIPIEIVDHRKYWRKRVTMFRVLSHDLSGFFARIETIGPDGALSVADECLPVNIDWCRVAHFLMIALGAKLLPSLYRRALADEPVWVPDPHLGRRKDYSSDKGLTLWQIAFGCRPEFRLPPEPL